MSKNRQLLYIILVLPCQTYRIYYPQNPLHNVDLLDNLLNNTIVAIAPVKSPTFGKMLNRRSPNSISPTVPHRHQGQQVASRSPLVE